MSEVNAWCPRGTCDGFKAPELLCGVCLVVYDTRRSDMEKTRDRCAKVADEWEPPPPPDFENLALTAEMDRLDTAIRPIKIQAARAVAQKIKELSCTP